MIQHCGDSPDLIAMVQIEVLDGKPSECFCLYHDPCRSCLQEDTSASYLNCWIHGGDVDIESSERVDGDADDNDDDDDDDDDFLAHSRYGKCSLCI